MSKLRRYLLLTKVGRRLNEGGRKVNEASHTFNEVGLTLIVGHIFNEVSRTNMSLCVELDPNNIFN